MAKIHILEMPRPGRVRVAIHFPTPATSNSAGVPWSAVLDATGRLGVHGSYLGVDATEIAEIEAGDVMEITTELHDNEGVPAVRQAALDVEADREIADHAKEFNAIHAYYGYSFGAVT